MRSSHDLTEFEDGIHGLNEPCVVRCEPLRQLGNLGYQVSPDILVPGLPEVPNESLCDDHHVQWVGHLVEQVQRLQWRELVYTIYHRYYRLHNGYVVYTSMIIHIPWKNVLFWVSLNCLVCICFVATVHPLSLIL